MQNKQPVVLNESTVEIEGNTIDYDNLSFWADSFRRTDLLRYQDGDVKMMYTETPETTTYELIVTTEAVPDLLTTLWKTGERFSISVENSFFDLAVDNAWIANLADGVVTIIADVTRQGLASGS